MRISRRHFLRETLGAGAAITLASARPSSLGRAAERAAAASPGHERETVLVVIQLSGGNDGLNTVVPYDDDAYHRRRPTLRLRAEQVHKVGSGLGLHPDLESMARFFQEGRLSIVQGVGYPQSKRDHDEAKRDWETARPNDPTAQTGWVGRTLDQALISRPAEVPGLFVGQIEPPFSLRAEQALVPTIHALDRWLLAAPGRPPSATRLQAGLEQAADTPGGTEEDPLLASVRQATRAACVSTQRLLAVLESKSGRAHAYPAFPLAQALQTVANLVRAELGIRIYFTELGGGGIGGFDTHADQAANHGALLRELAESVAAFLGDLRQDQRLDSVLVMTFSEFGRTLSENGRRGTNHGAAAPIFLAGGRVKGGVVGAHPSLGDLEDDAPRHHTDFRRVYATVLQAWLGFDPQPILGTAFAPLPGILGPA